MFGQQVVIDARLVIETFEEACRDQLDQVLVTLGILAEQHQVIGAALAGFRGCSFAGGRCVTARSVRAAIMPAASRDVDFTADDRLYAPRGGFVIKMLGGKEISVVGDGHGGHMAPRGFANQFTNIAGAVEKAVVCVQMQMDERRCFHSG